VCSTRREARYQSLVVSETVWCSWCRFFSSGGVGCDTGSGAAAAVAVSARTAAGTALVRVPPYKPIAELIDQLHR
jgi:hypothetical protein